MLLVADDSSMGEAPTFVLRPRDQEVVVGEGVYLHCGANGRDREKNAPSIAWLKDGATVDFE